LATISSPNQGFSKAKIRKALFRGALLHLFKSNGTPIRYELRKTIKLPADTMSALLFVDCFGAVAAVITACGDEMTMRMFARR
jgi:hypothetical protein